MAVRLSEIFVEIGARTAKLRKGLADAGARFQKLGNQVNRFSQDNKVELAAMSVAGILAFKNLLDVAGGFEASMKRVAAVSGATGDEFKALEAKARELGETTQFSASQAAAGMEFLAKAGFDANKTLEAIPFTLQLAASATLELGQAADIVTNIMAGFNLEANELGRVNDVLVNAFTSSNTNLTQLGEAMKLAGPVAKGFGQSLEDTVAILGTFGDAGFQGSLGGTALRGALIRLSAPSKEVEDILKKVGVTVFDTTGKMRPMLDIFQDLGESIATPTEILQIFGQRAGPAITSLLGRGIPKVKEFSKSLEKTGTAARIAAVQMEGYEGAAKELTSAFEGLKIAIATSGLLQFATKFARALASVIREAAKFSPALLGAFTAVAAAATALTTSLAALGLIGPFVAKGWGFMSVAGTTLGLTMANLTIVTGALQIALVALAAPIAILVSGFVILGVGIKKTNDAMNEATISQQEFKTGLQSVTDRMKEGFSISREFAGVTVKQAQAMGSAAVTAARLSTGIRGLATALSRTTDKDARVRIMARIQSLKELRATIGTVSDQEKKARDSATAEAKKASAREDLEKTLFQARSDAKRATLRNELREAKVAKDESAGADALRRAQTLELETIDSEAFKQIVRDKSEAEIEEMIRVQNARLFNRELEAQAKIESDAAKVAQETVTRQRLTAVANKSEALITGFFNKNLTAREKKQKAFRSVMSTIQSQITKSLIKGIAIQNAAEKKGAIKSVATQAPVIASRFFSAFAEIPFIGQALAVAAIGAAFGFIASVTKFNKGGVVPGLGTKDTVPAMLTPGERVLTRGQNRSLMAGKMGGGGRSINVSIFNPVVDSDERLDELADAVGDVIIDRLSLDSRGVIP